jgi:hypothetical protein
MRKFDHYPIYINHPGRWEKVRQGQLEAFRYQRDSHMVSWLTYTGKRLYEIMEDKDPDHEGRSFENDVHQALRLISSTRVGKLVLDCLDQNQRYWIVPLDSIDQASCECGGAYTFPGQPKEGGGIRIYIDASARSVNNIAANKLFRLDDKLFHELVHAYRMGSVGYGVVNSARPMKDNDSTEEFLALQLQNVYLANRHSPEYYLNYGTLKRVSKSTAYEAYSKDGETLAGFKYWVLNDRVAGLVSQWMQPPDSFNCFRDRKVLERIFESKGGRVPYWQ